MENTNFLGKIKLDALWQEFVLETFYEVLHRPIDNFNKMLLDVYLYAAYSATFFFT